MPLQENQTKIKVGLESDLKQATDNFDFFLSDQIRDPEAKSRFMQKFD